MIISVQRKKKIGGLKKLTFLDLIPKETCPSTFSRFMPKSLCNSSYKIITEILSTHMKTFLPNIISENQGGFISNRKITDSIMLSQEAIHSSMMRSKKRFVLKLDIANAFEKLWHSFLLSILQKMGFEAEFISLIHACISNPWISPLFNGKPRHYFQSSRG